MLAVMLSNGIGRGKEQTEIAVPPPPPPVPPVEKVTAPELPPYGSMTTFYKQNPGVEKVAFRENKLTVELKTGKKEEYNLSNEPEKKSFLAKFKMVPAPPPPPPPPPAKKLS